MKIKILFSVLLLIGLASAAPFSGENDDDDDGPLVINEEFFPESFVIYTAQHDIVNLILPLNDLNFKDDSSSEESDENEDKPVLFFVEADIKDNGEKEYKGLYVLNEGKATKVLDNGVDVAPEMGATNKVYIGAKDGIYVYELNEEAKKYGSFAESVIGVAKENGTGILWVLTENKDIYKVTHDGDKYEKVDDIKNVQQIVLDWSNNLFYISEDKKVYVVTHGDVKKIEGLPESTSLPKLLKAPFIMPGGVPVIIDDKSYLVYPNGTSEFGDLTLEVKVSAAAPEGALIQYAAYKKKIYEYNLLAIVLGDLLNALKNFLDDMKGAIQTLGSKTKNEQLFR